MLPPQVISMSALVTAAKSRMAYTAARSLGKRNIRVISADNYYPSMTFFSKYSSAYFVYPPPFAKEKEFVAEIIKQIRKFDIEVILPIHEEIFVFSKYLSVFKKLCKIEIPPLEKLLLAHDKVRLLRYASSLGIPIPRTFYVKDLKDLKSIAQQLGFPAVIKPRKGRAAQGVRYVHSSEELFREYTRLVKEYKLDEEELPFIQEYIKGQGFGVSVLMKDGVLKASFTHKRLREFPITGGPSTLRESTRMDTIERYAWELMSSLKWTGVAMVEFKIREKDGKPFLLEVNPRFWGSLNLAVSAGVDFPYMLYKMSKEGDIDKQDLNSYKLGVKSRWLYGDFRAFLDYIPKAKNPFKLIKEYLNFWNHDIYYDDFALEDPLPFLISPIYHIHQFVKTGKFSPPDEGIERF